MQLHTTGDIYRVYNCTQGPATCTGWAIKIGRFMYLPANTYLGYLGEVFPVVRQGHQHFKWTTSELLNVVGYPATGGWSGRYRIAWSSLCLKSDNEVAVLISNGRLFHKLQPLTRNDESTRVLVAADDDLVWDGTTARMPWRGLNWKMIFRSFGTRPFRIFHI